MKAEVKIPEVGESISEVTIGQWVKQDGDYVEMDEVICEIESEKATLEIRADQEGVLRVLAQEGESYSVGEKIAEIETDARPAPKPAPEKAEEEPPTEEKEEGEPEEKKAPAKKEETARAEKAPETEEGEEEKKKKVRISPVAAKLLDEAGISRDRVRGSGPNGRITKADAEKVIEEFRKARETPAVEKAPEKKEEEAERAEKAPQPRVVSEARPPGPPGLKRETAERREYRKKMSTLRRTVAEHLVKAKNETAMLTTFNEVNMTGILELRKQYKELFQEKYDVRLGFMSFFVKAVTIAVKDYPEINASVDGEEIVYHDYCDVGIAVATPKGLVVPVLFDADRMSIAEIEKAVGQLAERGRDNKLTIEEMTGGTISITNGGVFGSLLSTPIINAPQSAILGMHKVQERPMAVNGQVVIQPMMYVALSYDHRIIDGKESVSFLVRVKELLEDPARMLLEI